MTTKRVLVAVSLIVAAVIVLDPFGSETSSRLLDRECREDVRATVAFNLAGGIETDNVAVLDAEGDVSLVTDDDASWDPSFSPDGRYIAFVRGGGSYSDELGWDSQSIYVMEVDGSHQRPLTPSETPESLGRTSNFDAAPVWSPDGGWIAFSRDGSLMVAPASGGEAEVIHEYEYEFDAIDWSPDSQRLLVGSGGAERNSIFVLDRDGSNHRVVIEGLDDISELSWSPDGETLAFGGWDRVYLATFEDPNPRLVARRAHTATFSPDGTQLLYFEGRGSRWRLVTRSVDGGEPRPVDVDEHEIYSFEKDIDWLDCAAE